MRVIESEIVLSDPPAEVWEVLTDFASYPEWNPFLPRMDARLVQGERFTATSRLPSGIKIGFVGRILSVSHPHAITWVGRPTMLPSAAMRFRHTFTLTGVDGGTRLHQREEGTGFLVPVSGWILGQARKGQVAMNEALDARMRGASG